jgi:hypothetical protein
MAHRIQAINAYRPRIEQGNTVQKPELIRALSHGTSLLEGSLAQTLSELKFQIISYCRAGRAVKVDGLGIWSPSISLDGKLSIQYRPDLGMDYELNDLASFTGTILNRENIGKTSEDLVNLWNEDNPDNQVVLAAPVP